MAVNLIEGGQTPICSLEEFAEMGFLSVGFVLSGLYAATHALQRTYSTIRSQGCTAGLADQMVDFSGFYELIDAAYREKGCHLLKSLGPSPLVFISREPLNTVQDLKGLKIRGSGAAPDLITNLGAVPVTLAPAELYMALQTGTVDGVIMPNYTIGTLNLWDVAKGLMGPPFGQVAGDMYVNLEVYNGLSDDLKEIVEEAAEDAMHHYLETLSVKMDEILELAEREHGVTMVTLADEEYAKILEAAAPILDQTAARSPGSEKIIQLMREYLAEKGTRGTDQ